ncbi:MAG: alanine--tRNA ligase [Actinomycetota bacterium]
MDSKTIRDRWLAFFEERGHTRVPSASLVPGDPSLLFTNAGMNQFKPYFQGEQTPPYNRAVSVQKCMRAGGKHNDLEEVGRTTRHLTFFEMLGNFSFGDYYKSEICAWSWELVTEQWGIDPELLWVTVYETDDEANDIWVDEVGVRPERVLRLGKKDNFWSMGVAGPCGPCSEIHIDRGEEFGEASERGPIDNDERYVEFWNLVFMENDCDAAIEPVADLPKKNIDTGAGLERIAMILQRKHSILETDILLGMIDKAASISGRRYGREERVDFGLRVLADHGRSITFMVGDGVLPSNEERGYVLRRIMRRAIRHARLIGHEGAILPGLIDRCVELMGDAYPEIVERRDHIKDVATREEERFTSTLKQGLALLEGEVDRTTGAGRTSLGGDVAFKLHDTFGFPIDLTTEIAAESGLEVDTERFGELMTAQRERARAARTGGSEPGSNDAAVDLLERRGATQFLGYEFLTCDAEIVGLTDGVATVEVASERDEIDVILDRTVFYAEGGGQVGDSGVLRSSSGEGRVVDTQRLLPGLTGHRVQVTAGELRVGDSVQAVVDARARLGSQRAHTATHILHWILRDRLGEHATQAGSLVEPGRLRFDFNHFDALGESQLADISAELQERVLTDDGVRAFETSFDYARSIGAMAIFGEKYGDFVRVVEVGDYSKELCGGTHVVHTSNIGVVVVTGEGSIGSNLRRVEALVGRQGVDHLAHRAALLEQTAQLLRARPEEVGERVERLLAQGKEMERKLAEVERRGADADAASLAADAVELNGTRLVVARRDLAVDALRALAQNLKSRLGSAFIVLGAAGDGSANLVGALSRDLVERGLNARDLLKPGADLLGGGGGGKPDLAISGGPRTEAIDEAIEAVAAAAKDALQK